jgi:hypothetical protein
VQLAKSNAKQRKLRVNMTVHAAFLRMKCKQMVKPPAKRRGRKRPGDEKWGGTRFFG